MMAEIAGMDEVSFQPGSGAQGIYVMMGSGNAITANQLLDNAA